MVPVPAAGRVLLRLGIFTLLVVRARARLVSLEVGVSPRCHSALANADTDACFPHPQTLVRRRQPLLADPALLAALLSSPRRRVLNFSLELLSVRR